MPSTKKLTIEEYEKRIKDDLMRCSRCKFSGSICFFNKQDQNIKYSYCAQCRCEVNFKYQKRIKNTELMKSFGISVDQYDLMLKSQKNKCQICKKVETYKNHSTGKIIDLAVDHCHSTGKIRGLLCRKCNQGLGHFEDSIRFLNSAILYLKNNK